MDLLMFVFLCLGVIIGGLIGYLIGNSGKKTAPDLTSEKALQELNLEKELTGALRKQLDTISVQAKADRETVVALTNEKATLAANYKNLYERLTEQKSELQQLQEQFTLQFKNLANEIFEEKSKKFTDQNKTNLYDLLKPLGEKITDFEKKVDQSNKENLERNTALREQIIGLRELNQKMSQDAENLTKALKGDTKIQGDWGELILERILEQSGLEKDREYFVQQTSKTEEGRRLRPDVVVRLPDDKNIIIDSKVSLVPYERYANAENDTTREQALKEHIISTRAHIKNLGAKNYNQVYEHGSLDYVLMFVPIESAFALIVQHGEGIYNEAYAQNIILVSPATLIATLRTITNIWRHEYQNQNALEIARQGGALYDKFKAFVDDLIKVGQSLKSTQSTYEEAMKKLYTGKDNLIRKTERLRELGAKSTKTMDSKMLNRAEVSAKESSSPLQNDLFGN